MLFNTVNIYNYRADAYGYTTTTGPDGAIGRLYATNPTPISFALTTSFVGDIVISSETRLQKFTLIRNITDRNGSLVFSNGVWEIYQTQPSLNAVGIAEGYRYKARLILGDV